MRKSPLPQYSALVEWAEGEVQKELSPTAVSLLRRAWSVMSEFVGHMK